MKIYNNKNVFEAALDRIRRVYDDFENVYVSSSAGKDSTICLELAIIVAREKGRLPVDVCFCDQESEYQSTVDYLRKMEQRKEVRMHWFQVPFKLNNATTLDDNNLWMKCWDEECKDKWMRPHEPNAITKLDDEITKGKELDFYEVCSSMGKQIYGLGNPYACLCGITAEESLNRYTLMHKKKPVYKDIFWCSAMEGTQNSFRFYPIYDWKVPDVWHAIAINHWQYNTIYDAMFKMGVNRKQMRVSSIIHETALWALHQLKEIEPETFEKLTQRIGGVNTYRLLMGTEMYRPSKLPPMFTSWVEYRNYLLNTIISDAQRPTFLKFIKGRNTEEQARDDICGILVNDICGTNWKNVKSSERLQKKFYKKENKDE